MGPARSSKGIMNSKASQGKTPDNVAATATQKQAANLAGITLIGLNGATGAYKALVRIPGGRIKQVTPGSRLSAGKIIAIDENGLILEKNGRTRRVEMPGS